MQQRVYFSMADRQLESFIEPTQPPEKAFEKSLILNVLFQSQILVPDIFLFISKGLEAHIKRYETEKSLFEVCVEKNIVIPAFRNADISSFQDALYIVRGKRNPNEAIQGIQNHAEEIAQRLQLVAEANPKFSPEYWPQHDMGEKFDQVIERYLMRSDPPDIDENSGINRHELRALWNLTKRWRLDCILEARNRTQKEAGKGLRRGEIMNAVGRNLGLPESHKVHDVSELFSLPQSPQEKRAIRLFCRWMTECYQYNQAIEFKTTASFPGYGYGSLGSLIPISILPFRPKDIDSTPVPEIKERVPHPPLSVLFEVSPTELVAVRQDLGLGYFAALARWQGEPNSANAEEVRQTLRQYSQKLLEWAQKKRGFATTVLEVLHIPKTEESQQLLSFYLDLLKTLPVPGLETLIVALEKTVGYYQIQEESQIELKTPKSTFLELPELNISDSGNN